MGPYTPTPCPHPMPMLILRRSFCPAANRFCTISDTLIQTNTANFHKKARFDHWHLICIITTNQSKQSITMKRTFLGEFEEVVLLVVAACTEDCYGVTIWEQLQEQTGRSITISAVHATLYRLEEKGYLSSQMGGATAERGGRRKRFFMVTALGSRALLEIQDMRQRLWEAIPQSKLQLLGQ